MSNRLFKKTAITFISAVFGVMLGTANADMTDDLNNFVDNIGGVSSSTNAQIVERQGYRYATGGRFMIRAPSEQISLGSIKFPNYRTGSCGSIDVFNGALSFVSANELVTTLQNVGSNALPSYAFMLALRTISSQITDTLQETFGWMKKLNEMNISSCEAAAWAVNSAVSGQALSREQAQCIDRLVTTTNMEYSEAKAECGITGSGRNSTLNNNESKTLDFIEGNMAWIMMHRAGVFANDIQLREALMSITGTITKTKVVNNGGVDVYAPNDENARIKTQHHNSILFSRKGNGADNLLDAIMHGGNATIFDCQDATLDEFGCKMIGERNITFDQDGNAALPGLLPRSRVILDSIYTKIRNKQDLTVNELDWITSTSMPVYRLLTVGASLRGQTGEMIVEDAAQAMAWDYLREYLAQMFEVMIDATDEGMYGEESKDFKEKLLEAKKAVNDYVQKTQTRVEATLTMVDRIQFYEKLAISSMPSNIQTSLTWNSGYGGE